MNIQFDQTTLPVLHTSQVVIVGGSFAGVAAALALADAGQSVTVVEPRTYLGRELTATGRPRVATADALPNLIQACIKASEAEPVNGEYPLRMDKVKKTLEDRLLAANVKLLYASLPVELCLVDGIVHGIVIGNKSGRQVIQCQTIIDTTETALVAKLAGAEFAPAANETATFKRVLEFTKAADLREMALPVPPALGLVNNQVQVQQGCLGSGHCLVDCVLELSSDSSTALALSKRDLIARRQTMEVAIHLLNHVPAFAGAHLSSASHELWGNFTGQMAPSVPDWCHGFDGVNLSAGQKMIPVGCFAGPVAGLWCLNEAARFDGVECLRDAVEACRIGAALAEMLVESDPLPGPPPLRGRERLSSLSGGDAIAAQLTIKEQPQPQRGRQYEQYSLNASPIPILRTADVLVVGGGTSGATAAATAAQQGVQTVLVEMNPGLGGTGTYGGIHTYWYGRWVGYAARIIEMVDAMHDRLRQPRMKPPLLQWNIEGKVQALLNAAEDAGVELLLNAMFIGTIVEGNSVRGVVVATRTGPVAILARVTIDASGDADVAAFAGAEFVYGSERDHSVMYTYMAQVPTPGRPRNVKTSMIDVSNIEDLTRGIMVERRRGEDSDYDHGIYMAPRESRHIKADVTLSLTDQLLKRCWPDVVNICFSNNDIKGQSTSEWVLMGLISPNLEIEIPYRALLPKGMENIIVVGKAYSASHDALAAPRMQPDLENLGGVGALAAVLAVKNDQAPREIDVTVLQAQLVEAGVLPERILRRILIPTEYTTDELNALINALEPDRPLHAYSDMELNVVFEDRIPIVDLLCAGPQVVPVLETAHKKATGKRKTLLAQALAMVGSKAGIPTLLAEIEPQLTGETLPERTSKIRHAGFPPDQGAAPDVAFLMYSLAMLRDERAIPIWQRLADLLATATEDTITNRRQSLYFYAYAIGYGAERLGHPAAVPILKQVHSYAPFRQHTLTQGFDPDYLKERLAYLELVIGRALARCGSPDGFIILFNYLQDARALLTEHAHTELIRITGEDFGKDVAAWGQWLEANSDHLEPVPWLETTDAMQVWDEVILREADIRKTK
jgi:ribulose 1,5-bisphosphate synthetase/thiazole synthase